MDEIKFSNDEKNIIIKKIQQYFTEELNQEIGEFDAQFLLDFFSEEVGSYFYNRGLYDAHTQLDAKIDDLKDSFYELEKITEFRR